MTADDLSGYSMHELFLAETEGQSLVLTTGLLALERAPDSSEHLESCMRAAHSLKGAARIIDLEVGVRVAHAMEDCFVAAQAGRITLRQRQVDILLNGVDLLTRIARTPEADASKWMLDSGEIATFVAELAAASDPAAQSAAEPADKGAGKENSKRAHKAAPKSVPKASPESVTEPSAAPVPESTVGAAPRTGDAERVLRVTAANLNRLLALSGESLVESRWLKTFAASLLRMQRRQFDLGASLDALRDAISRHDTSDETRAAFAEAHSRATECQRLLSKRLAELDTFDLRATNLANRLYDEAIAARMRPFGDGVKGFPRMVRDVARSLGKSVRVRFDGESTRVDRDILEKLEAPLGHLLRNAVDHGIESPEARRAAGKPEDGVITVEASHRDGALQVTVSDDGGGIAIEPLRAKIVARRLTSAETAARMSETELLEFLFLPGFTLREVVTDVSGRGVGLDVVQDMVKTVRGTVRVTAQFGVGTRFQLQLPLTLSVVRALVADIGGEFYAFPLSGIQSAVALAPSDIELLEGKQHFAHAGRQVGLVTAQQLFGGAVVPSASADTSVIVIGSDDRAYGLVVDRIVGRRELVVQQLDNRLGKVKDIAAGALMDDGDVVLIVDTDDLARSIEKLVAAGRLTKVARDGAAAEGVKRKRILVVDDSLTVRELERKLLANEGYEVEAAVDGMDGWHAARMGHFDLVVTDIDMPRMDGIELVTLIKQDPQLKATPVMIVSYKDREEDRRRGLEAGADYYLAKGSFHDQTLLQAVADLIGRADA